MQLKLHALLFFAILAILLSPLLAPGPARAHFGMIIPSHAMIMDKKDATLKFSIAFAHPFSRQGMAMRKPREFFVFLNGQKTNIAASLQSANYFDMPGFSGAYAVKRPGVYQFAVVPEPYFERAEDCFIIHYAKTIIGAFGSENGWEQPIGLPVEIVPLSRPFGNYAGNVFTGMALKNGKPMPNAVIEAEFLNEPLSRAAANSYFETQTVLTDKNGVFNFGIPWPGWWGFAALTESEEKLEHQGTPKNVELGGIIWVNFHAPKDK